MANGSTDRDERARRRTKKFLARCERALSGPVHELRETQGDGENLGINIEVTRDSPDGGYSVSTFELPALDPRLLDSVIVDCRVFFTAQEDSYLPSVVAALRQRVGPERSAARKPLAAYVGQVVKGGRLVGATSYSGRLENVTDLDSVRHGVLLQMNQLLRAVENVRAQIVNDLENDYLSLDPSSDGSPDAT